MKRRYPLLFSALLAALLVSFVNSFYALSAPLPFSLSIWSHLSFSLCNIAFFLLFGMAVYIFESVSYYLVHKAASGISLSGVNRSRSQRFLIAAVIAASFSLFFLLLAQHMARSILNTLHNQELITLIIPALILCILFVLVCGAMWILLIVYRSPSRFTLGVLLALAVLLGLFTTRSLWGINRQWVVVVMRTTFLDLVLLLCVQCVLWAIMRKRAAVTSTAALLICLLVCLSLGLSLIVVEKDMNLRFLLLNRRGPGWIIYKTLLRATDWDGDGYSFYFGTRDKDDRNPRVHALAEDIPGNGIDENCLLGDFQGWEPRVGALCRHYKPPLTKGPKKILFISIETFRGGILEGEEGTRYAPHIRDFASKNILFQRAYVTGPNTGFMVTAAGRSKYVLNAYYTAESDPEWITKAPSVATFLKDEGYRTLAILPDEIWHTEEKTYVIKEGFEERAYPIYPPGTGHNKGINSPELTRMSIDFLKRHEDEDLFLWIHYYDPHRLYLDHPGFTEGNSDFDRYKGEIKFADHHIGQLLDYIENNYPEEQVYIFIFSDHGEAFGEHGQYFHGYTLFEEEVRVPLIMKIPSAPSKSIDIPVSLIDVAPTLLDALKLEAPGRWQGESLLPLIFLEDQSDWQRKVFFDYANLKGMIDWPFKIIWDVPTNWMGLYNLDSDSGERVNLYSSRSQRAKDLKHNLENWMERDLNPWF